MTTHTATRTRRTPEQRRSEHYLNLAILVRQQRLHRMPIGITRASFDINGAHIDLYASETYRGYGYIVRSGDHGYECGCESFENRGSCKHTRQSSARAVARYEEAKRQAKLAAAAQVAPLIVGSAFAGDLQVHAEDELSRQAEPYVLNLVGQKCPDPVVVLDALGAHVIYQDRQSLVSRFCRVEELPALCPAGYRAGKAEDYPQFFPDAERERKLAAQQAYRDIYPDDFYCAVA